MRRIERRDRLRRLGRWAILFLLGLIAGLLAGCGGAKREQAAADATAGAEALALLSRPEASQTAALILEGVKFLIRATVGGVELPEAKMTPAAIIEDPQKYRDEGEAAFKASLWSWGAWAVGGLLVLFGALKAIPGTAGWAASIVHSLLANRADRAAKAKEDALREGFATLVRTAETAPPELAAPIKRFVAEKVAPKVPNLGAVIEAIKPQART